tara:strand:+ start:8175 stop:8459 length:285 start_codon:yes stop_codon:yes gene_type:complete
MGLRVQIKKKKKKKGKWTLLNPRASERFIAKWEKESKNKGKLPKTVAIGNFRVLFTPKFEAIRKIDGGKKTETYEFRFIALEDNQTPGACITTT